MHTVNHQLFQNFDHLVDIESLIKLKPLVSAFIAKNFQYIIPTKFAAWSFPPSHQHKQGIADANAKYMKNLDSFDHEFQTVIQNLSNIDCLGSFCLFEEDVVLASFSFNVRYNLKGLPNKHLESCVAKRPIDSDFDFFYNWLEKQNIFEEYGRVVFFINYPGSNQVPHYDPIDNDGNDQPDEFILINFNPKRKRLYLLDDKTNTKYYSNGYINWFNTINFHGADTVEYACYTLRIDGTFSDQFRQKFMAVPRGNDPLLQA
jgi:hypothetical protein